MGYIGFASFLSNSIQVWGCKPSGGPHSAPGPYVWQPCARECARSGYPEGCRWVAMPKNVCGRIDKEKPSLLSFGQNDAHAISTKIMPRTKTLNRDLNWHHTWPHVTQMNLLTSALLSWLAWFQSGLHRKTTFDSHPLWFSPSVRWCKHNILLVQPDKTSWVEQW